MSKLLVTSNRVLRQSRRKNISFQKQFKTIGASVVDNEEGNYVSPFKDFFTRVQNNDNFGYVDNIDEETKYLKCGIREDALRFQTAHYGRLQLPPHVMPMEHRVMVTLHIDDIPLKNSVERQIFEEIVGPRLKKKILKISSNQFGSRIENKRHLVTMLDRLVSGAQRLAEEMEKEESSGIPA